MQDHIGDAAYQRLGQAVSAEKARQVLEREEAAGRLPRVFQSVADDGPAVMPGQPATPQPYVSDAYAVIPLVDLYAVGKAGSSLVVIYQQSFGSGQQRTEFWYGLGEADEAARDAMFAQLRAYLTGQG